MTEQVWASTSEALRAFFRRRVRDESLVEDLLHETFVRAHQRLSTIRDEERIARWMFRIARHVLADHFRGHRSHANLDAEVVAAGGEDNLNREVEGWLRGFLRSLAPEYREAVELAEIEGLTHAEVARRLGLSLSGAKSRVQRGRAQLRALLVACCHLDFDRRGNVVGYERHGGCGQCGR